MLSAGTAVKAGNAATVHCTGFGKGGDLAVPFWSTRDRGRSRSHSSLGRAKSSRPGTQACFDCCQYVLHRWLLEG